MADHYEDYTREQLMRRLREHDKRPRFGLVRGSGHSRTVSPFL